MGVVYKITNTVNGKVYVGKTMIGHVKRWIQHRTNARAGLQHYLYRAMRKYGEENFACEVLATALLEEEVDRLETEWITTLCSADARFGYNCTMGGDGRVHTASSKARQKGIRTMSPEARAKISAGNKGKVRTPAVAAACGVWRGKKVPAEIIAKRVESIRKAWTPEKRAAWGIRMREQTAAREVPWTRSIPTEQRARQSEKMKGRKVRLGIKNSTEANRNVSLAAVRGWEKRRATVPLEGGIAILENRAV